MAFDRDLYFGISAVGRGLITPVQLATILCDATQSERGPLAERIVAAGRISRAERAEIEAEVAVFASPGRADRHSRDARTGDVARAPATVSLNNDAAGRTAESGLDVREAGAPPPPEHRYRNRLLHKAGGMGRIWLVHDDHLRRQVALKEILPERRDDRGIRALFVKEARVTACLQHPNIVPIHEIADDAKGDPFYTMRFVAGGDFSQPITAYHDARETGVARRADLRELLRVFVAACQTIAYANDKGIIHRDLKPANVLVGDFGEVFVIDWGLAKASGGAEAAEAVSEGHDSAAADPAMLESMTRSGKLLGTAPYMPPEQADGHAHQATARSDVYGLGAILYRILTDRPPFVGDNLDQILRRVVDGSIDSPTSLVPNTSPSLAAICMKALRKDPADRYSSAKALGDDVVRWLDDEPVEAYPETWTARVARWSRRRRGAVAAGGLGLLATTIALAIGLALVDRARNDEAVARGFAQSKRAEAEANADVAYKVTDALLVRFNEDALVNLSGSTPIREGLFETAVALYAQFLREHPAYPRLMSDASMVFRRAALFFRANGNRKRAERLSADALSLATEVVRQEPAPRYRDRLSELLRDHGTVLRDVDGPTQAVEEYYVESLKLGRSLRAHDPKSPDYQRTEAMAMVLLGELYCERGSLRDAEEALTAAAASFKTLNSLKNQDRNDADPVMLSFALTDLARVHRFAGDCEFAIRTLKEPRELGLAAVRKSEADRRNGLPTNRRASDQRRAFAAALIEFAECRPADAQDAINDAIDQLTRPEMASTMDRRILAEARIVRAELARENPGEGSIKAAQHDGQEAHEALKVLNPESDGGVGESARLLCRAKLLLGRLALARNDPPLASKYLTEALVGLARIGKSNPHDFEANRLRWLAVEERAKVP